jgi:hypothetical protein
MKNVCECHVFKQFLLVSFDETSAHMWVRALMEENYQFWLHVKIEDDDNEDFDDDYNLLYRVPWLC